MIAAILEIVAGFFKALPLVDKWFSSTPTEKAEEAKKTAAKKASKFRKAGRK